jgi:hypothetical protein
MFGHERDQFFIREVFFADAQLGWRPAFHTGGTEYYVHIWPPHHSSPPSCEWNDYVFPHRSLVIGREYFLRLADKLFYVTAAEVTELNLGDIRAKKHGWHLAGAPGCRHPEALVSFTYAFS